MSNEIRPPEPAAPQTRTNCFATAGITCLVLLIVGALVGLWGVKALIRNPVFKQGLSGAKLLAECQFHLQNPNSPQNISAALERYRTRNGRYPDKLTDLCPDFLENKTILHCPADDRPKDVVSYEYTKPDTNAPGTVIVVECKRHVIIQGQPPLVLTLTKDGRVLRSNYTPSTGVPEPKSKSDE
jgi:hypothetical protein